MTTDLKITQICKAFKHVACRRDNCNDCAIRENHKYQERLEDYWKHFNSGAEPLPMPGGEDE